MKRCLQATFLLLVLTSCTHTPPPSVAPRSSELLQFAKANCLFWYFKKKGYDVQDIRAISGGMVELGSAAAEQYERIAQLVKDYKPQLTSKQEIDVDLLKCFTMEQDAAFLRALHE